MAVFSVVIDIPGANPSDFPDQARIVSDLARMIGDKRRVGEDGALGIRGLKADQRIEVRIRPGQRRRRITVTQQALIYGEMILTAHELSDSLQRAFRRTIRQCFSRSAGRIDNGEFIFNCAGAGDRDATPKPAGRVSAVRVPYGSRADHYASF